MTATAMTRDEIDAMLHEHFEAERTKDIDRLLATFHEDATHDVVEFEKPQVQGLDAIGRRYQEKLSTFIDDSFDHVRRYYGPDFVVDESVAHGWAVGRDGERGERASVRILHVFEFRDGKIARENVWTDIMGILRQAGEMPRPGVLPSLS